MEKKYNQITAMLAITKASLRATLRSPSSIAFSIGFPLVFILVFGFLGNSGGVSLNVVMDKNSDTTNVIYPALKNISNLKFKDKSDEQLKEDLEKGRITAIIKIVRSNNPAIPYTIELKSSESVSPQNLAVLKQIIQSVITGINAKMYPNMPSIANISNDIQKIPGRVYRTIDFILPGQLGFSLLSAGVFGVAFLFFNLRQHLVLKRFFATPIKRSYIVLGEALGRIIFQLITAVVIIVVGKIFFHFTLVHGIVTFINIMILSFLALIVFMGFGFIVSGIAKNESTIPPFANIFTLPQFLLAGTFFSIDNFPAWMQPFCNALPLTQFNNAMRAISFEGASLISVWKEIGILAIWGVLIYYVAIKTFKWE
jgi:ABC-2 type transport system permease protein